MIRCIALAAGIILSVHLPAGAAVSEREQAMEARIRLLEERLRQMESRLDARVSATPRQRATSRSPVAGLGSDATGASDGVRGTPTVTPPISSSSPDRPTAVPPPPSLGVGAPTDAPQEAFVFRDNAVTLRPRRLEASTEVSYARGDGFLQTDRAITSTTSLRVGVLDWLELNATVPAYTSWRTRGVGPFRSQTRAANGLGDVLVQGNARLHEQTASLPGVVLSAGVLLPTGAAPYNFDRFQPDPNARGYNPNPTNLNAAYFSRGAWGVVTNLQVYKTIDPIIVFFGIGTRHLFPQNVDGRTVQAGTTFTYNVGFSLALSEKSTLGFQIAGAYQGKLNVDGRSVPQSDIEPVTARVSVIQRVFENTWIEPSLTAGLTNNSPGFGLGVGLRHRF